MCFFAMANIAVADWNSGLTIEDVSTRIAINIVDDNVELTIALTKKAVTQLEDNKVKTGITIDIFSQNVIKLFAKAELSAKIKTSSPSLTEIVFPFSGLKPHQLDIIPDFDLIKKAGDQYIITVSHHGLPVIDHGILTKAETLLLDWEDPWYSQFTNPELKRDHNDPVMAFLYIEPFQIKSEIIVRVKEMSAWTELQLRDSTMIYPDEFLLIKQKIGQFLLAQNKISTESKDLLSPVLDRVDFIRMGAADIQAYKPQQAQKQVSTLIGVSISYQTKALPKKIRWEWNLFNKKLQRITIRAYDPAGLFDSYVTPAYPIFEWENMLADIELSELTNKPKSIPVISDHAQKKEQYFFLIGLVVFLLLMLFISRFLHTKFRIHFKVVTIFITLAIAMVLIKNGTLVISLNQVSLSEQQSKPVLNQLLWNIYQAFESKQEETIYDQLELSVSGDLRETLYLQNRQAFLIQDGAQSKINTIEIKRINLLSTRLDQSYLFDCEWLVIGDVIHWGHQHRRENLYRANIKIAPVEGNWKIIELESVGQQRVNAEP